MKSLFIGGAADGKWLDVPEAARKWEVGRPVYVADVAPQSRVRSFTLVDLDSYTASQFGGPTKQTRIFYADRLGLDGAMEMLLAFYQRPAARASDRKS
jgi:hypothetical protein